MPVHEDAEGDRRGDQRGAGAVSEHDREDEGGRDCQPHGERERLHDVLRRRLAEVLGPQEEDRIRREEEWMDATEPAGRDGPANDGTKQRQRRSSSVARAPRGTRSAGAMIALEGQMARRRAWAEEGSDALPLSQ